MKRFVIGSLCVILVAQQLCADDFVRDCTARFLNSLSWPVAYWTTADLDSYDIYTAFATARIRVGDGLDKFQLCKSDLLTIEPDSASDYGYRLTHYFVIIPGSNGTVEAWGPDDTEILLTLAGGTGRDPSQTVEETVEETATAVREYASLARSYADAELARSRSRDFPGFLLMGTALGVGGAVGVAFATDWQDPVHAALGVLAITSVALLGVEFSWVGIQEWIDYRNAGAKLQELQGKIEAMASVSP